MKVISTLKRDYMLKSSILGAALIGFAGLALASSGGGEKKKKDNASSIVLNPYKKYSGFSLRAGRMYDPSLKLNKIPVTLDLHKNSILTLRKGNTIFILPSSKTYTPSVPIRSNLNVLQFRLPLHR